MRVALSLCFPGGTDQYRKRQRRPKSVLQLATLGLVGSDDRGLVTVRKCLSYPHFFRIVCELLPAVQAGNVGRPMLPSCLSHRCDRTSQTLMRTAKKQIEYRVDHRDLQ